MNERTELSFPTVLLTWPRLTAQAFKAFAVILTDLGPRASFPAIVAVTMKEFGRRLGGSHSAAGRWFANLVDCGLVERVSVGRGQPQSTFRIFDPVVIAQASGFRIVANEPNQGLLFEMNGSVQPCTDPGLEMNGSGFGNERIRSRLNGSGFDGLSDPGEFLRNLIGDERFEMWFGRANLEVDQNVIIASVANDLIAAQAFRNVSGTNLAGVNVRVISVAGSFDQTAFGTGVAINALGLALDNTNTNALQRPPNFDDQIQLIADRINSRGVFRWVVAILALLIDRGVEIGGELVQWSENDLETFLERVHGKPGRYFTATLKGRLSDQLGRSVELPKMTEVAEATRSFGYRFDFEAMKIPIERLRRIAR